MLPVGARPSLCNASSGSEVVHMLGSVPLLALQLWIQAHRGPGHSEDVPMAKIAYNHYCRIQPQLLSFAMVVGSLAGLRWRRRGSPTNPSPVVRIIGQYFLGKVQQICEYPCMSLCVVPSQRQLICILVPRCSIHVHE